MIRLLDFRDNKIILWTWRQKRKTAVTHETPASGRPASWNPRFQHAVREARSSGTELTVADVGGIRVPPEPKQEDRVCSAFRGLTVT